MHMNHPCGVVMRAALKLLGRVPLMTPLSHSTYTSLDCGEICRLCLPKAYKCSCFCKSEIYGFQRFAFFDIWSGPKQSDFHDRKSFDLQNPILIRRQFRPTSLHKIPQVYLHLALSHKRFCVPVLIQSKLYPRWFPNHV